MGMARAFPWRTVGPSALSTLVEYFPPPLQAPGWYPIVIGGGGYMIAMDRHADTTTVHRTDTYGAYIWDYGEEEWVQLITYQTMPTWFQIPRYTTWTKSAYAHSGVYEIRIAPTDSNTAYMQYLGFMFKTTNLKATTVNAQGITVSACTWTLLAPFFEGTTNASVFNSSTIPFGSALPSGIIAGWSSVLDLDTPAALPFGYQASVVGSTSISTQFNVSDATIQSGDRIAFSVPDGANAKNRVSNPKMAIHPTDPNTVWVGTPNGSGLWKTANGGTTWTALSTSEVPTPAVTIYADGPNEIDDYTGLLFDPSDATHQTIYVCSNGNGFYVTTNGGTSWAPVTSGGPTTCQDAKISSTGVLFLIDKTNVFWRYSGGGASGTWTTPLSGTSIPGGGLQSFAVDSNHVVVFASIFAVSAGSLIESTDGGVTFPNGWNNNTSTITYDTAAIPWIGASGGAAGVPNIGADCAFFTGPGSNEIWTSANIGFWSLSFTSPITPSSDATWTIMSQGQEQIVANSIVPIVGGGCVLAGWDFGSWFKPPGTLNDYASVHGPADTDFAACWSIGSNGASFFVAIFNGYYINQIAEYSGFSTDSGQTWSPFSSYPPGIPVAAPSFFAPGGGGSIDVSVGSTTNFVWAPGNGYPSPYYTTDGSSTWHPCVFEGILPITAISSGTYNSTTGLVTLTLAASVSANSGSPIVTSGLTGTGTGLTNLQGSFVVAADVSSSPTIEYYVTSGGLGSSTATVSIPGTIGGTVTWSPTSSSFGLTIGTTVIAFDSTGVTMGNYIVGTVSANTGTSLSIIVTAFGGSGSISQWNFDKVATGLGSVSITGGSASGMNSFSPVIFDNARTVAADKVNPNTFYAIFNQQGFFKSTDGGATWQLQKVANPIDPNAAFWYGGFYNVWMMPGHANTGFYTSGVASQLAYTLDGGVTWSLVSNVASGILGYGVSAPGKTWPTIFIVGFVGGVYGIWGCADAGDNPTNSSLWTWTKYGDWPDGTLDEVTCVSGDNVILNQIYLGKSGSGWNYYKPS